MGVPVQAGGRRDPRAPPPTSVMPPQWWDGGSGTAAPSASGPGRTGSSASWSCPGCCSGCRSSGTAASPTPSSASDPPYPFPGGTGTPWTPQLNKLLGTRWMLWERSLGLLGGHLTELSVLGCSGRGAGRWGPPPKHLDTRPTTPGFPDSVSRALIARFPFPHSRSRVPPRHFWVLPAGISPHLREGESGGIAQTPSHGATDAVGQSGGTRGCPPPKHLPWGVGSAPAGFDYPGIGQDSPRPEIPLSPRPSGT